MPLTSVGAQNASNALQVVHFKLLTTGETDGKSYLWDVYLDPNDGLVRATLFNSSNIALYTDFWKGQQVIRCEGTGRSCADISSQSSSLSAADPQGLGDRVQNFLTQIYADLRDAELWNTGMGAAPRELDIGSDAVYVLAFDTGPYPMYVYVSAATKQVVGIISDIGSKYGAPGGKDAIYPLVDTTSLGSCNPIGYPVIAFLPDNSPNVPNLQAPTPASGGKSPQITTVATCQG